MRQNVTFDEIVTAAELILSEGSNPTIEKVRISIGSRGSNSTISKHLNNWRKHTNHQECYVNHTRPINENIINPISTNENEIKNLHNELENLRKQYNDTHEELALAKNELNSLHKYHLAWQNEKEQYIADLKLAHKISLEVLTENYRNDINKMEIKVNSLLDKIEKYVNKHNQEREALILRSQELTLKFNKSRVNNIRIKRKLLTLKAQNTFLQQCGNHAAIQFKKTDKFSNL
jgi:hypothetical protein